MLIFNGSIETGCRYDLICCLIYMWKSFDVHTPEEINEKVMFHDQTL
jgi:hypothetical protein